MTNCRSSLTRSAQAALKGTQALAPRVCVGKGSAYMPKRLSERQQLALRLEQLTDAEIAEVLDYVGLIEQSHKSAVNHSAWDDELVAILSDAPENRRARQAFAWEAVRRRAERRTITPGSRAS